MEIIKRIYDLEDRTIQFALMIIDVVESMPNKMVANYYANQLLRSGSSPALNYAEAQVSESRADFIHKMKICLKELNESRVILRIIKAKNLSRNSDFCTKTLEEAIELTSIFSKSIKTAKTNKYNQH